jgi:hypothetical protein
MFIKDYSARMHEKMIMCVLESSIIWTFFFHHPIFKTIKNNFLGERFCAHFQAKEINLVGWTRQSKLSPEVYINPACRIQLNKPHLSPILSVILFILCTGR